MVRSLIEKVMVNSVFFLIKNISYENVLYKVIYFKNEIEKMFLVEKILQLKNPERYIQISEKCETNAFIIKKLFIPKIL
ncbi:hypothetical protein NLB96_01520 [Candidatus Aminicenantes bacterium AC-335-K20]|jgi:hypothetical protein|nr:hypothetical protein [SCandidatus Aminicenantes bacterium Aminicenantia_JdfR_composite]MCP2619434.1 hypothetical protein [Candidatus Aminicenantes bacterium AC-335-K20]